MENLNPQVLRKSNVYIYHKILYAYRNFYDNTFLYVEHLENISSSNNEFYILYILNFYLMANFICVINFLTNITYPEFVPNIIIIMRVSKYYFFLTQNVEWKRIESYLIIYGEYMLFFIF